MSKSGTFDAAPASSDAQVVGRNERLTCSVTPVGNFVGIARLLYSENGGAAYQQAKDVAGVEVIVSGTVAVPDTAGGSFVVENNGAKARLYKWSVIDPEAGFDDADDLDWALTEHEGEIVEILLKDSIGRAILARDAEGNLRVIGNLAVTGQLDAAAVEVGGQPGTGIVNLDSFEAVETNGSTPTPLSTSVYQSRITSGGSQGSEDATIGDGTGVVVGTRKLLIFETQTDASDEIALDHANILALDGAALQAATLDDEGAFLLLEWQGAGWLAIAHNGDVTLTDA